MGIKSFDEQKSSGLALLLSQEGNAYAPIDGATDDKLADSELSSAVAYVLELSEGETVPCEDGCLDYACVRDFVARRVSDSDQLEEDGTIKKEREGRIGPSSVSIDQNSATGELVYEFGGFALESLANFSSCRATTCVYKGKWMYEATVATDGIQQIGWATLDCPFTAEEGVGDFHDSYAYDGKRVNKWNRDRADYGQPWAPGDVIGCCIDLDSKEITFYRNGASMGVAYTTVRTLQPRLAYFPAISLSYAERCELNFGNSPFIYPVPGYQPLSDPLPPSHLSLATYLLSSFKRLIKLYSKSDNPASAAVLLPRGSLPWEDAILLSDVLLTPFSRLLTSPLLVQSQLLTTLLDLHSPSEPHCPSQLSVAVRLLQISLPPSIFTSAFTKIFSALAVRCKTGPLIPDPIRLASYPYMALAAALVRVPPLRDVLAAHPHFNWVAESFLTRKQPTTADLKIIIPQVWWPGNPGGPGAKEIQRANKAALASAEEKQDEQVYCMMCSLLGAVRPGAAAGRSAFESLLEHVVSKNKEAARDVPPAGLSDPSVVKSMFYVVLRMLRHHLALAARGQGGLAAFPVGSLFVQGSGSTAAMTDSLAALSRLGGVVSHLAREVRVPFPDLQPIQVELPVSLSWPPQQSFPDPDSAVCSVPNEVLPRFLAAALLLYTWKVGPGIHLAYNLLMSSINTANSLEELERHVRRAGQAADYQQYLSDLRTQLREELSNNARKLSLVQPVFGSLQKMEAMFALSVYLSSLVHRAADKGALLSWLPAPCMDIPLDLLLWLRRSETHFAPPPVMEEQGLHRVIALLPRLLNDGRICNPEVKEAILTGTATLLESQEYAAILERNETAQQQLVPAVLDCFDSKLWHSVSIILQRMLRSAGFGKASQQPKPLSVFQSQVQWACRTNSTSAMKFMNRLLNTLNWALTDFSIIITDVHQHPSRWTQPAYSQADPGQSVRKCIIMFDLSCQLLRILEFVAREAPTTFLSPPRMNLTRLLEVLGFVLSHFAVGPDARKLKAVLQRAPTRGAAFLALDRISLTTVLAPVAGILLGLYNSEVPLPTPEADKPCPSSTTSTSTPTGNRGATTSTTTTSTTASTVTTTVVGGRSRGILVSELASSSNAQLISSLEFLPSLDWRNAFPNDPLLTSQLQRYDELLDKVRSAKADLEARRAQSAAGGTGTYSMDPPEEFLDPITQEVMDDPVVLPDSGITLDRGTLLRHFMSQNTDPFSRKELTMDVVKGNAGLKERIRVWREEMES